MKMLLKTGNDENLFTLLPQGGLGNRMRVIASALAFCEAYGYRLKIAWINNKNLGCDVDLIFKSLGKNYILETHPAKLAVYKLFFRFRPLYYFHRVYKALGSLRYRHFIVDKDIILANHQIVNILKGQPGNVFLSTCYVFFPFERYDSFVLSDAVQARLAELQSQLGSGYVGVHIRGTDHLKAKLESPFESYLARIEAMVKQNPGLRFFVASDEQKYKDELANRFGDRIITFRSKLKRNSEKGVVDAVLELYCLSKASIIICSRQSSFSDIAIQLGAPEKVIYITGKAN